MNLQEAMETLELWQDCSVGKQTEHKEEICCAFEIFINSNPTKSEFVRYTSGLVLFPEMIYALWRTK